ncbi:acyltransferase domain-containing protein [Streptomyces sp. NBC_01565]|uniref:ACP S-malonyltransferase n=1 Tax=unclassified Streptomyces TaxID=2593676 RepID=UPI0022580255|nr:acyltransferase domain-containing protein [Streptomyces sp. NBC_01565]MCX4545461.1 acyltransferase domain-containing protein [Streptomyces sp. NBC_01565]
MPTALAFPGQGALRGHSGAGLLDRHPGPAAEAEDVLGHPLRPVLTAEPGSPERHLTRVQPTLFVLTRLAALDLPDPDYLVGHSMGELTALCHAGCVDFTTGLRLVLTRARLISQCPVPGGMLAVTGIGAAALTALMAAEGFADLDLANLNAPDQTVLAGPTGSLRALAAVIRTGDTGAKATLIDAPNPGHSRYMAEAAAGFARVLAGVSFAAPRIPVISNVTARPHVPERMAELLAQHLYRPVHWSACMRYLRAAGVTELHQAGPGGLLPRLWDACAAEDEGGGARRDAQE